MSKLAVLNRLVDGDHEQSLGRFHFYDGINEVFSGCSLELADRGNQRRISRIPAGKYWCEQRESPKYGQHYWVKDVPGRDMILIHFGNKYQDTLGCIILGDKRGFVDINGDGHLDVVSSKHTMQQLRKVAGKGFWLYINDYDETGI